MLHPGGLRQPEGQCRQHGLCGHGVVQGPLGAWLSWLRGLQFARGLREGCPGDAASHGRGVCRVPRAVPLTSVSRRREQCGSGTRWAVRSDSLGKPAAGHPGAALKVRAQGVAWGAGRPRPVWREAGRFAGWKGRPEPVLLGDNVFSFVFTETNRQVASNLCQMGSWFGKPVPSSPFEREHVLV